MSKDSNPSQDEGAEDSAYADRINELVSTLNDQAKSAPVVDVADSAIYAAARYLVFAHATQFESKEELERTREEAVEHFLDAFRHILNDNMDEQLSSFDDLD